MGIIGKLIFDQTEPSNRLFNAVWRKIEEEKINNAKKQAFFFGIVSVFSLISVVLVWGYLVTEFYRTGFYDYASLLFSDWNSVAFFWKEVIISMAESLPVFELAILFVVIVVFLKSIKSIIKNVVNINYLKTKLI